MTGSDRRGDAEWPIGSEDADRPASREEDRALRFGGEHERYARHEPARAAPRPMRDEALAPAPSRRGINPVLLTLGGLVILLLLAWLLVGKGNPDQDKLTNPATRTSTSAASTPEKLCASNATYDSIKRELFRRAAQVRGNNASAYDQIANSATLRMQNPVLVSEDSATGAVNCSGSLSLDLPPGLLVVGGRTNLAADVDYTVQPAADGTGNVVLLKNADSVITPLATLARNAVPPPPTGQVAAPQPPAEVAPVQGVSPGQPVQAPAPQPQPGPAPAPAAPHTTAASAHPSFSCGNARTRGEIAICGDPELAALDRRMAIEYGRAAALAAPDQRALLRETAHRFYAYRDRCPDAQCIAAAYNDRVREIRDIIEGRWQPPR